MMTADSTKPHRAQLLRYLTVGACNTVFGYGCYALFTMLLTPRMAYGYVVASVLANFFSINFAFLGYKWFVFRTRGNYLIEWIRCLGVYGSSMLIGLAGLAIEDCGECDERCGTGRRHREPAFSADQDYQQAPAADL